MGGATAPWVPVGNFPQAFSNVGLINAAWRLDRLAASDTASR